MRWLITIVLCFLILFGCDRTSPLNETLWTFSIAKGQWTYGSFSKYYFSEKPVLWNDYILIGNDSLKSQPKGFYILDKTSGSRLYHYPEGDTRFTVIDDEVILAAKTLFALDLKKKKKEWEIGIENSGYLPLIDKENIYLKNKEQNTSKIIAIDRKRIEKRWEYSNSWSGYYEINPKSKLLYYTSKGFILKAIKFKSLEEKWKVKGEKVIYHDPVLYKNRLIVFGGTEETITAFDPEKGDLIWKTTGIVKNPSSPYPVFRNNTLFLAGMRSLVAIDIDSGKIVWKVEQETDYSLPLQIINDGLYWPRIYQSQIDKYDKKTGNLVKTIQTNHLITSPVAYDSGILYYVSKNILYAEKVSL